MGSAPAHHLGTIIMKFLLVVALVVAADAFVLPSSYLVDRPVPDHSLLVHDGLHLQPVQVPGVPALFASPPVKREKRQTEDEKVVEDEQIDVEYEEDEDEDVNADPAYIGTFRRSKPQYWLGVWRIGFVQAGQPIWCPE